jgi:hypothetical protein
VVVVAAGGVPGAVVVVTAAGVLGAVVVVGPVVVVDGPVAFVAAAVLATVLEVLVAASTWRRSVRGVIGGAVAGVGTNLTGRKPSSARSCWRRSSEAPWIPKWLRRVVERLWP